jgi:hypothetical protein
VTSESVATKDKQVALALLEKCLESGEILFTRMMRLGDTYYVDVLDPMEVSESAKAGPAKKAKPG